MHKKRVLKIYAHEYVHKTKQLTVESFNSMNKKCVYIPKVTLIKRILRGNLKTAHAYVVSPTMMGYSLGLLGLADAIFTAYTQI